MLRRILLVLLLLLIVPSAVAAEPQKVDVEGIREKYWAQGKESQVGVVQNRIYSKEKKFHLGVYGGLTSSDPFLNTRNLGLGLGYHFSEFVGIQLLRWRSLSKLSDAHNQLELRGATANTNFINAYTGLESNVSVMYGKVSLLGELIVYYDLHLIGGLGRTETETGNYLTGTVGIGQQFYLQRSLSLRVDYRLMPFRENLVEKEVPHKMGEIVGSRTNWSNVLMIGVSYLFGPGASM